MRLRRYLRFHYIKILRLKDTPAKIAKGVALGVALDFLPMPFISLVVAWVVARLARFNTLAAVTTTAALKPAVFTVFFPFNILVGKLLLGERTRLIRNQQILVPEPSLSLDSLKNFFSVNNLKALGPSFLTGSVVNAMVSGLIVFVVLNRTLVFRQQRRLRRNSNRLLSSSPSKLKD